MLYLFLSVAALSLAAWDAWRRALAHDRARVSALSEKLTHLVESNRLQKAALENFLKQISDVVGYSESKKRDLELKLASRKL
jgi:two-component sensor histidine kinase